MLIALRRPLARLPDINLDQSRLDWHFAGGMMTIPGALMASFQPIDRKV